VIIEVAGWVLYIGRRIAAPEYVGLPMAEWTGDKGGRYEERPLSED